MLMKLAAALPTSTLLILLSIGCTAQPTVEDEVDPSSLESASDSGETFSDGFESGDTSEWSSETSAPEQTEAEGSDELSEEGSRDHPDGGASGTNRE